MKIRGQLVKEPMARIMAKVRIDEATGCWLWLGAKTSKGYGRLTIGSRSDGTRRTISAHANSMIVFRGKRLESGQEWCHSCDTPPCINPDHLSAGTRQDNVDDRERKGRNIAPIGERNGSSKLKESQILEIREYRESGANYRQIAERFDVHPKTIQDIILGRYWSHVLPAPPVAPSEKEDVK